VFKFGAQRLLAKQGQMLQVCQRANVIGDQVQLAEKFSVVWNLSISLPNDLSKLLFLVENKLLRSTPLTAFEVPPQPGNRPGMAELSERELYRHRIIPALDS
jgi:hypothetical protein